jgi:hypothetical protein
MSEENVNSWSTLMDNLYDLNYLKVVREDIKGAYHIYNPTYDLIRAKMVLVNKPGVPSFIYSL